LAEALEPFAGSEPVERPHYWGHRQRLRERALEGGLDALPDYELLELALFGSIRRADTKPLAKALLERFGGLGAVLAAPEEELYGFELVNQQTVANFRAIRELAARLAREEVIDRPLLNSIDKVVEYCRARMAHSEVEEFRVLYLDQRNALIDDELQQRGTVNEVAAYPRQIMRRALNLGAVGLVLCHNHPSGNLKPSAQDIEITREIFHAAEAVGVTLHDHLIVGAGGYTSLRDLKKIPRTG
jgi:DNA repair protein RadC